MAKVILKQADVQEYRNISAHFNQERFDAFAFEIQQTQLRELLNDALYYALYNDLDAEGVPATAPYTTLVNGESYKLSGETIQYFGLKPFLCYHWLGLNVREGDYFQADYGNIQFSDNPQDNMQKIDNKKVDRVNSNYMEMMISYSNNIKEYLNNNQTTYPLWKGKSQPESKSSFNSFTI